MYKTKFLQTSSVILGVCVVLGTSGTNTNAVSIKVPSVDEVNNSPAQPHSTSGTHITWPFVVNVKNPTSLLTPSWTGSITEAIIPNRPVPPRPKVTTLDYIATPLRFRMITATYSDNVDSILTLAYPIPNNVTHCSVVGNTVTCSEKHKRE